MFSSSSSKEVHEGLINCGIFITFECSESEHVIGFIKEDLKKFVFSKKDHLFDYLTHNPKLFDISFCFALGEDLFEALEEYSLLIILDVKKGNS